MDKYYYGHHPNAFKAPDETCTRWWEITQYDITAKVVALPKYVAGRENSYPVCINTGQGYKNNIFVLSGYFTREEYARYEEILQNLKRTIEACELAHCGVEFSYG